MYVVFHRHGHRAPARDILQDALEWKRLLPHVHVLEDTNKRIKITNQNCPNAEPPRDRGSHPFGALTEQGRSHLLNVGRTTRQTFPDMLKAQSINAYSTNYQRTQLSGQSFLLGLLDGSHQLNSQENAPSFTVRKSSCCSMAFFDAHPNAEPLLQAVRESAEFVQNENNAKTVRIKDMMLKHLPLLRKADGLSIDWPAAFDYVKCRPAHDLPLHPEIESSKADVMDHVTSRYRMYYKNKALLGHAAGPLFADTLSTLLQGSSSSNTITTIFSGHDVTLLALLHGLGASVLMEDASFWPDFGCTVVFERRRGADDVVSVYLDGAPLRMRIGGREVCSLTLTQLGALTETLHSYTTIERK